VSEGGLDPRPVSGRQELLENLVNQQIWAADRAGR
jgi:xylose isomerase